MGETRKSENHGKEVYVCEARSEVEGGKVFIGAVEGKGESMTMKFEVCDVKKALAAVWRIAAKGNRVCFGPDDVDCYIQNVRDGRNIMMRSKEGSYVMDVLMNGESKEMTAVLTPLHRGPREPALK